MIKQNDQMQRHHEIQKERLMEYKENEEKWEAKRAILEEALNHKNNSVLILERKLRDVNDELVNRSKALKNAESECTRLQQEVEELRKNNESQREEYHATVADWRSRLEKTVADHLSSAAADMERNADMAREMLSKTEEVERLQRFLENEKKQVQSIVEEWSLKLQEKSESVKNLEAELARRDELEKTRICEHCEILRKTNQIEREEHAQRFSGAQARIDELEKKLSEREELICEGREELKSLLIEKERIGNEREDVVYELERTTESLKEARFIMDGLREEIATFMADSGCEIPLKMKDDEKKGEIYRQFSRVTMIIEAYGRQFEQLEMRMAIEDKQRERRSFHDVDVTETLKDLEYRLFAANQKLAVCEKERAEWKDIIERMEVREEQAKQKNVELTDEVNRWRRELDGLKEEKMKTQKMVSDYRAELGSKSMQLEKISKSLEDSQKNNMLNLQLIRTLKEEYDHKTNTLKHQEERHAKENEELRSLCIKKEEQLQVLQKKISRLEKTLKPYQKENVNLRSEVDSLRKENDNYKVALEQVKPVEVKVSMNIPESSNVPEKKSLLEESRERDKVASASRDHNQNGSHDPSAILTTRSSVKGDDNLRIGATYNKALSAHRFLKRTSFYQMSRNLSESRTN